MLKPEELDACKNYTEDVYKSLYYLMCSENKIQELDKK